MNHIHNWKLDNKFHETEILSYINNNVHLRKSHLLDLNKDDYTLIEKITYDIAMFHLNRLNITNTCNYHIEFYCKTKTDNNDENNLFINTDENMKKNCLYYYPLLTCITYFYDNINNATLISNIDVTNFKYKKFENQQNVTMSLPTLNKHVAFDGNYYHGNVALNGKNLVDERYELHVNIWDKQPSNTDYYKPIANNNIIASKPSMLVFNPVIDISNVKVSEDIINYKLFDDLLYEKDKTCCYVFSDYISSLNDNIFRFELDLDLKRNETIDGFKIKYGNLFSHYQTIVDNTELSYNNRFLQRRTHSGVYPKYLCNYISNKFETYVKANNITIENKPNSINIDKIPEIYGIIVSSLSNILDKVTDLYNLNVYPDIKLNIIDILITKYNPELTYKQEPDKKFITFNILLNDDTSTTNGKILFGDGLCTNLCQGDLLIYNSLIKYTCSPITDGICYLLTGTIGIHF